MHDYRQLHVKIRKVILTVNFLFKAISFATVPCWMDQDTLDGLAALLSCWKFTAQWALS